MSDTAVLAVVGEWADRDQWDRFVQAMSAALNELGVPCTVNLFINEKADLMERAIADTHSATGAGQHLERLYRILDRATAGHYANQGRDFGRGVAYLAALLRTGDDSDDPHLLDDLDDEDEEAQP